MSDLQMFFQAVTHDDIHVEHSLGLTIDKHTQNYFPSLEKEGLALIYVPEFRNSSRSVQGRDDSFRDAFYHLFRGEGWKQHISDLGDLLPGETVEDTYFALSRIISDLIKRNIIPIVIGGSMDLTFAVYQGFERLEQLVNICCADTTLNVGSPDEELNQQNFVSHILMQRPCYLFNLANIGFQAPYNGAGEKELFEKLYFDFCRLGEFNMDFKKAEPHLRNSDIFSLNVSSIRHSDFPSSPGNNPNGFYADQVCQLSRYAGISDKLSAFCILGLRPNNDQRPAADLVAQMIWYFIEGVTQRKGDFPIGSKKDYMRFAVHMDNFAREEIIFYKSQKSGRWWMEVPYPPLNGQRYLRHHLVPCDHDDYQRCMNNEVPDLWWKTYQKLD